jgi:hypothetical protein
MCGSFVNILHPSFWPSKHADNFTRNNNIKQTNTYRITVILKVETDTIANTSVSPIGQAGISVIMSVDAFRTDVIVFTRHVICFTSDWPINLRMRVTNWPNIFVDQGQFSDPDFISCTHQRENVQFADKNKYCVLGRPNKLIHRVVNYSEYIKDSISMTELIQRF